MTAKKKLYWTYQGWADEPDAETVERWRLLIRVLPKMIAAENARKRRNENQRRRKAVREEAKRLELD